MSVFGIGLGQDQDELVPSVAPDDITCAGVRLQYRADVAEGRVTTGVAVGVVEQLETIDIEHHQGEGQTVAFGSGLFSSKQLVYLPMVREARERIRAAEALQSLDEPGLPDRLPCQVGEPAG